MLFADVLRVVGYFVNLNCAATAVS